MALNDEELITVPGMLSRYVRLPNGTKAHYMTSGETGPAVLLLHGGIIGSSATAGWRFMAPFLGAHGFRVYCPDLPGFGHTSGYESAYPAEHGNAAHVDFLHDFVNALCLDSFHISGNSMGCLNAVNYTLAHPERVSSYALIAGGLGDLVPSPDLRPGQEKSDRPDIMAFDGTPESMRKMMSAIIRDSSTVTEDLVAMRTAAALRHQDYYRRRTQLSFGGEDKDIQARLSTKGRFDRLSIPGIYLYGKEDVLVPHDVFGYPQEDALPGVQFFYPEDTGHQGQTDQPELVNQLFLEFFRDGKVSWETAQWSGISDRRPPLPELVDVS
ncbi:alpha/beta fold hydrolase [Streptomyces sp. T028]|uniref:alpha/beta fold hydrolase n=1 Tax=Streptomyces sp. T028 TaxID=3394379 RepID=UPI003A89465C